MLEVIPGKVYVNKFRYYAERMANDLVKYSVRYFILMIFRQNALVLCTRAGGAASKKKGDKKKLMLPKLSPDGVEAVHCEYSSSRILTNFYFWSRVRVKNIVHNPQPHESHHN